MILNVSKEYTIYEYYPNLESDAWWILDTDSDTAADPQFSRPDFAKNSGGLS